MNFARLQLAARALRALAGLVTSAVPAEDGRKVAFRGDRAARRSRAKFGWRGPPRAGTRKPARLWLAARSACLVLAFGARLATAQAPVLEPAPPGIEAAELSRRAAEAFAGERTWFEAELSVRESGEAASGEVRFRAWQERSSGRSFLRVLAPEGQAGMGLLRLPPNLWRYAPRTASVERVESALLVDPWFRSDFPLADLLGPPAALGAQQARLLGVDPAAGTDGAQRAFVLELRPGGGPEAGSVIAWIGIERATPLRCDRRDPAGALVSSLRFDEVREVQGRAVPHRWTLTRPGAPEHESRIELREIRFDPVFDDEIFTTRQLLQRGGAPAAGASADARLGDPGGSPP